MHRIWMPGAALEPGVLDVEGDEARHIVRVRRARAGEPVQVLDGVGGIAAGEIIAADRGRRDDVLRVQVRGVRRIERARPEVRLWTATPKGGRLEDMVDQLGQAGAASWSSLSCARSETAVGPERAERLKRVVAETCKQCGRAWGLELGPEVSVEEIARDRQGVDRLLMADAGGVPLHEALGESGASVLVGVLVGPEGGWTAEELSAGAAAGGVRVSLGPHVMRIETAAIVAAGAIMAARGASAAAGG